MILCIALQKHELPTHSRSSSAGLPMPPGAEQHGLPALSEQELLMLQQTPQTSQTHNAISFWLERVSRANLCQCHLPC